MIQRAFSDSSRFSTRGGSKSSTALIKRARAMRSGSFTATVHDTIGATARRQDSQVKAASS
jgi:hypothetical protein